MSCYDVIWGLLYETSAKKIILWPEKFGKKGSGAGVPESRVLVKQRCRIENAMLPVLIRVFLTRDVLLRA